jgi:hypothetical protein
VSHISVEPFTAALINSTLKPPVPSPVRTGAARIYQTCKELSNFSLLAQTWHLRCIVSCVCQALGPTKKNGGNKTMAKKILKKAKKLEATKPLTVFLNR